MILIIAYGNSLRRDDGAGLLLAEELEGTFQKQGRGVQRIEVHQLAPELALNVACDDVDAVVFVDTRIVSPGSETYELEVQSVSDHVSPPTVGHHLSPATVMAYARLLYGRSPRGWLLTVPGVDFDHGEGLSEVSQKAIASLPEFLKTLPQEWPLCETFPVVI